MPGRWQCAVLDCEEQAANSRYFYEYASGNSGKFGFAEKKLTLVQAMHFKCGQGAKTGTGGHLPGSKVIGKIAEVRGLKPGTESISPSAFTDLITPADFKEFADRAREVSGGNLQPVIEVDLTVFPAAGVAFPATATTQGHAQLATLSPGATVRVRYNPSDPTIVVIG